MPKENISKNIFLLALSWETSLSFNGRDTIVMVVNIFAKNMSTLKMKWGRSWNVVGRVIDSLFGSPLSPLRKKKGRKYSE